MLRVMSVEIRCGVTGLVVHQLTYALTSPINIKSNVNRLVNIKPNDQSVK